MTRRSWIASAASVAAMVVAGLILTSPQARAVPEGHYCTLSKDRICVDSTYMGDQIDVSGAALPGAEVIIKVTSAPGPMKLARKGKVGPIWMNVADVAFDNAPAFYKVNCTETLNPALSPQQMSSLGLGYNGLKSQIAVKPAAEDSPANFKEFIGLKEGSGLYEVKPHSVAVDRQGSFRTSFAWPSNAPAGPYTVTVYEVKDGKLVRQASRQLTVERVGLARWLADMAQNHGAAYGLLAIATALSAGLVVGFVFKGASKGH